MKSLGRFLVLMILLALFGVGGALFHVNQFLDQPMALPAEGQNVVVKSGATLRGFLDELEQQGVLGSSLYLYGFARVTKQGHALRAGEFHLPSATTPRSLLKLLSSAKPIQYSLTLVEGWRFRQVLAAIQQSPELVHELKGLGQKEIMTRLGHEGEHPEGRFYPDTYLFERGMSDIDLLQRAYGAMQRHLATLWPKRADDLPIKTPYEALILASIIEKETGLAEERPDIAGVFVRRLKKGMRLQTDPTVIYGMGEEYDGNIRKKDLQTDTPYNTYTRKGLPPTPICMPGKAAIEAALHPKEGKSLYFVASGDGGHYFSATLREHNNAVRKYLLKK